MPRNGRSISAALLVAVAVVGRTPAQTAPPASPPAEPAATPPATPQATPPAAPPAAPLGSDPSLDELLGITKPGQPGKPDAPKPADADAAKDPKQTELERKLSDAEAKEAFEQAVRMMSETAQRLEKSRDAGLTTQRLQEEILRKLDALIKASQQQDSSSSSGSQSSGSSDPSQSKQPSQPQPQGNKQDKKGGEGQQAGTPPAKKDAQFNNRLDAARAAWGALPERLRDLFTQGMDDYYSKLYQSMTEQYYRKTAENATP